MKKIYLVLILIAFSAASCSFRNSLFAPKIKPHASPEALMMVYKQQKQAGKAKKIWSLYSDEFKARNPNGLIILQNSLENQPVSEIEIGNPITLSQGKVLYYNVVGLMNGEYHTERVRAVKNEHGKWFIDDVSHEKQPES